MGVFRKTLTLKEILVRSTLVCARTLTDTWRQVRMGPQSLWSELLTLWKHSIEESA